MFCSKEYALHLHPSISLNPNISRLSSEHVTYIATMYPTIRMFITSCIDCMTHIETNMITSTPSEDLPLLVNVSWVYQNELYKTLLSKA